jgi:hypothetical protein
MFMPPTKLARSFDHVFGEKDHGRNTVRAALLASGVYKLIARIAEATAEKAQFLGYLEDAAAELRDDIDNGDR